MTLARLVLITSPVILMPIGWPTTSMATSTPRPPVIFMTSATTSTFEGLRVMVAPSSLASSSRLSSRSATMYSRSLGEETPAMMPRPMKPAPIWKT